MEAVVGRQVSLATGLQTGDGFAGAHGLAGGGDAHGERPYVVTGVLAPCGCVADRLILTGSESVWEVHDKAHATDEHDAGALEEGRDVTMALVRYASPLSAASFPRWVNSETAMQAASPAVEVTRLLRLFGIGSDVLNAIGTVLLLTAALSVFIALWTAVRERRADLAMLRMLGASPTKIALLLLAEAIWLAGAGTLLGMSVGHGLVAGLGALLASQQSLPIQAWAWAPAEGWIPAMALATAVIAALVPAWGAYRVDVARLLQAR